MLLKYFAIAAIVFALLAAGLNKWKKKYGHKNSGKASGDTWLEATGSGFAQYIKAEREKDRQLRKAEQAADRATAMADKVYKASRGKAKGKGR